MSDQDAPVTPEPAQEAAPETFDRDYVAKLRAESAKYRTEAKANAKAAEKLAAIEEASKSELDKAAERASAAEARAANAEAQLVRKDIAASKGLKPEAAEFLTGSTPEEIEASAEKLLALMPDPQRPPGRPVEQLQSGAVPAANQSGSTPDDWIRHAVAARQSR